MKKGNLTREQAIAIVGDAAVSKSENANCDFTNRVMDEADAAVEFKATAAAQNSDGDDVFVSVYYYQTQEALDGVDDLGALDWKICGYEVE